MNENIGLVPPNKLIYNLLNNIFPKKNIESLSKIFFLNKESMFFNYIPNCLNVCQQYQYERLVKILADYPKLLNSSELLKLSRSVSYMTFILKEVFDYLNLKASDGTHVYLIRTARKTSMELKEKCDKLRGEVNNL